MSEGVLKTPEFSKIRRFLYPIHSFEAKKALPMGIMFFFILFNYTCLRNLKDALIVTAPNSGAEVLSFLKAYFVMPSAILFMLLYAKGSDVMSNEKLFHVTIGIFVIFFGIFGFCIYPNLSALHPSVKTVEYWQSIHSEAWRWPIAIIGNWSYALFFIMAELWGSAALSLLFWQFANQICKTSEAKRFYAFFGLLAQFSLLLAGGVADYFAQVTDKSVPGVDAWGNALRCLMGIIVVSGLIVMGIHRWIYVYVLTDKRLYDKPELPGAKKKKAKMGFWQSMKIMVTSPYLGLIAALVICYGIGVNVIEGLWKGQVKLLHPKTSDFNAFMGRYVFWTGIVSIFVMIIGGNILRTFNWFTAAVITPALTLVAGSLFFSFILWRENFADTLARIGTNPIAVAVILGMVILILAKSTKYALFDLTKEMAYIPLDEEMKVKGKVVVEVVGGRLGKAGGAWLQSGLLMVFGFLSSKFGYFGGGKIRLIDIAPYLLGILIVICITWILAVRALSKRIAAVTAQSSIGSNA
ncbi:MAG: NTP/NDP exchange transporter [Puniceicoccales bacterium]|jgi:AAA family ATP:ADP antiporter|nr:NTP/NDP exchange transporter [Puniceicoccales bacterium]